MRVISKIAFYTLKDVSRSRWLFGYGGFFFAVTDLLLRFGGGGDKALLGLIDVVLFVVPLMTIVFATVYLYHAREFIEMLLAQPIKRRDLFTGLYAGLSLPLMATFILALGLPLVLHGAVGAENGGRVTSLLGGGAALTMIFGAMALLIATIIDDRIRGLGCAVGLWLLFTVAYDGAVLLFVAVAGDHAIERPMLALMLANPVDLARVAILLRFDISALLGYTGAVLQKFFGSSAGFALAAAAMVGWIVAPLAWGARAFRTKDF